MFMRVFKEKVQHQRTHLRYATISMSKPFGQKREKIMLAYNQNSKGSKKNMFSPLCTWSSFIEAALPKRRQSCLCFGNVAETVSRSSEVFERRDRIMCIEYQRIPPEGLFVAELTSS